MLYLMAHRKYRIMMTLSCFLYMGNFDIRFSYTLKHFYGYMIIMSESGMVYVDIEIFEYRWQDQYWKT